MSRSVSTSVKERDCVWIDHRGGVFRLGWGQFTSPLVDYRGGVSGLGTVGRGL